MTGLFEENPTKRGRGRPVKHDRVKALESAMNLFWDRGYAGVSLEDLLEELGFSTGAFYNLYGSMENLYELAIEHYSQETSRWFAEALRDGESTRQAFEGLLETSVREFTRGDRPAGCMISLAETHTPPKEAALKQLLIDLRAKSEAALAERLKEGIAKGDLSTDVDVHALAAYFGTVLRGLAVQARDGKPLSVLQEIARIAMRAWPDRAQ